MKNTLPTPSAGYLACHSIAIWTSASIFGLMAFMGPGVVNVRAQDALPVINSFTPGDGPAGTLVTIEGVNFSGASAVKFGDLAAQFTRFGDLQIVAAVPNEATTGKITVITPAGTAVSAASFTVTQNQSPQILSFTPTNGPVGTEVSIVGEHLGGTTVVQFNGVVASFREGFGGTNVIATVPATATTGPLTISTSFGSYTTASSFTVTAAAVPEITGFSPASGSVGLQIVISGNNLASVTSVLFNRVQADFTLFGNSISAVVPAGAKTGPITVSNPAGASTSVTVFTVTVAGEPRITSLTPDRGHVGERITISGENIASATGVAFGGIPTDFDVFGLSLLATVPVGASSAPVHVTTPNGEATSPTWFTVLDPLAPEISGITPETGPAGTVVTITGTNLTGVTEVQFGSLPATFNGVSNSEVRATVPAGVTTGPISLTTPKGTAFSPQPFLAPAQITSFAPATGPVGTAVTIHGANFDNVLAVQFNGVDATYTTISTSEIHTVVPVGATSGHISIATFAGFVSSDTSFLLPPKIAKVEPLSGPVGSVVTIIGENFPSTTSVRFNESEAVFSAASDTLVTAVIPIGAANGPITLVTPAGVATSPELFYVGAYSDLVVGLTAIPDAVDVGDFLSYTVSVTNRGPLEAQNVVITDRLPPGVQTIFTPSGASCVEANHIITCHVDALAAGANVAIRITATVVDGLAPTNQVSVTSNSADPIPANNSATVVTAFKGDPIPEPDVTLTATLVRSTLQLSWPTSATGMILESTLSVSATSTWTPVTATPVVVNGSNVVTQPIGPGNTFYRLRKP
jgi:uncharacterized repeat protein (TIGR01451 family)